MSKRKMTKQAIKPDEFPADAKNRAGLNREESAAKSRKAKPPIGNSETRKWAAEVTRQASAKLPQPAGVRVWVRSIGRALACINPVGPGVRHPENNPRFLYVCKKWLRRLGIRPTRKPAQYIISRAVRVKGSK